MLTETFPAMLQIKRKWQGNLYPASGSVWHGGTTSTIPEVTTSLWWELRLLKGKRYIFQVLCWNLSPYDFPPLAFLMITKVKSTPYVTWQLFSLTTLLHELLVALSGLTGCRVATGSPLLPCTATGESGARRHFVNREPKTSLTSPHAQITCLHFIVLWNISDLFKES